jgi:hypothetical protein
VVAAPVAAHVTVIPISAEQNVATPLELEAPNERAQPMTGLTLDVPASVELLAAGAPLGWRVATAAHRAAWSGGALGREQAARFPVTLRPRGQAGTIRLTAVQRYEDGATVTWRPLLTVLPASGEAAPSSHVERALVAAGVGIVLVAGSLLLVHRLRRRSPARS